MNRQTRPIQAIVAGHLCLDLIPAFSAKGNCALQDILIPGKLIDMDRMTVSTGGAVSNTGLSLKMLGIETCLMGKIGSDHLGHIVRRIFEQYGSTDGLMTDPDTDTSYSIVIAPPGVDRIFLHNPGANHSFRFEDLDYDLISQARLFHFGYPPLMKRMYENDGQEMMRIFKAVKGLGCTTSLDFALPDPASAAGRIDWQKFFANVLPQTDICLPSLEELLLMFDRPLFEQLKAEAGDQDIIKSLDIRIISRLAEKLLDFGVKIVVIKLGHMGFYVRTADAAALESMGAAAPRDAKEWSRREVWNEIYAVEHIASTSGAGDASIAGFLAGLLTGQTLVSTVQLACAVAALKIQVKSSVGGLMPLQNILDQMGSWPKVPINLPSEDWRYQANDRLWIGKSDQSVMP